MKRLLPLFALVFFIFPHQAQATSYFIDFTNGKDTNTGLGTTSALAYQSLNAFANAARSPGDIAYVRRGQASTTNVTAVTFTSDGTLNNPIIITGDYDNMWSDFATSSVTGTAKFGSTYVATSASTTDAYPKKWVYFGGDCYERNIAQASTTNPCAYAYEVKSASSTGIDFYLPYKGTKSGAGLDIRVMPAAPIVGDVAQAAQILTLSSDDAWFIKGLDLRSTNASCVAAATQSIGTIFFDMVFQANGSADCGTNQLSSGDAQMKFRVFNVSGAVLTSTKGGIFTDFYVNCNSVGSSYLVQTSGGVHTNMLFKDGTVENCTNLLIASATQPAAGMYFINIKHNNTFTTLTGTANNRIFFQDNFGTIGLNSQTTNQISSNTLSTTTISTTTVTRSGGGPTTQYIMPPSGTGNTGISTKFPPFSYMKLGEWGFYAAANVSKTYTVYFRTSSTSAFTVNPLTATASGSSTPELYVECEYYKDASDADRQLLLSTTTGAVSFTSDTNWYGVSLKCQPTQNGILYLRAWYGKPKESPTNQFYMDTAPVVS